MKPFAGACREGVFWAAGALARCAEFTAGKEGGGASSSSSSLSSLSPLLRANEGTGGNTLLALGSAFGVPSGDTSSLWTSLVSSLTANCPLLRLDVCPCTLCAFSSFALTFGLSASCAAWLLRKKDNILHTVSFGRKRMAVNVITRMVIPSSISHRRRFCAGFVFEVATWPPPMLFLESLDPESGIARYS